MNRSRYFLPLAFAAIATQVAMADLTGDSPASISPPQGNDYVANPSFEEKMTGWTTFVPTESQDKNCQVSLSTVTPHSGATCCQLQSDDFARFSIAAHQFRVQAGDHYRVTVWVRADAKAEMKEGTPGIMLRVGFAGPMNPSGSPNFQFIGLDGTVARTQVEKATFGNQSGKLPTEWKKIEAVIEIPADAESMGTDIFAWSTKGSLFIDDFTVEKVTDASIPITPVIEPSPGYKS